MGTGGPDDGATGTSGGAATATPTAVPSATAAPGSNGAATPTARPGPGETGTATPADPNADLSFPPGVNASGVRNRTALFDAHRAMLGERDYATNLTQVVLADGDRTRTVSRVRSDLDAGRLRGAFTASANNVSVDTFRNESRFFRRQTVEDRTSYRARNATGPFASYHERRTSLVASSVYRFADYTANGTVERGNRTLFRFDLADVNESAVAENVTVTGAEGTLLIDGRGLIHRSTLELHGESADGDRRRRFVSYRVTRTGDLTVERPDWLATAAAASGG